jgi:hypothetical protein
MADINGIFSIAPMMDGVSWQQNAFSFWALSRRVIRACRTDRHTRVRKLAVAMMEQTE